MVDINRGVIVVSCKYHVNNVNILGRMLRPLLRGNRGVIIETLLLRGDRLPRFLGRVFF